VKVTLLNTNNMMMNALMLTHVLKPLPTARQHALVCSSGSQGYKALKETLQNGVPGHTLLIESGDLCEMGKKRNGGCGECGIAACCIIATFPTSDDLYQRIPYSDIIPPTVTRIRTYGDLLTLPNGLLENCTMLTTVDFSPLTQVIEVQKAFLQGCSGLTTINLEPLSNVTEILGSFLEGCSSLKSIDLSPLSQVLKVQEFFLGYCSGLTTIGLSIEADTGSLVIFDGM
jgi:hypothetical protein